MSEDVLLARVVSVHCIRQRTPVSHNNWRVFVRSYVGAAIPSIRERPNCVDKYGRFPLYHYILGYTNILIECPVYKGKMNSISVSYSGLFIIHWFEDMVFTASGIMLTDDNNICMRWADQRSINSNLTKRRTPLITRRVGQLLTRPSTSIVESPYRTATVTNETSKAFWNLKHVILLDSKEHGDRKFCHAFHCLCDWFKPAPGFKHSLNTFGSMPTAACPACLQLQGAIICAPVVTICVRRNAFRRVETVTVCNDHTSNCVTYTVC